jgi:hypothetical protein
VENLEETGEAQKSDPAGGPFLKSRGMACGRKREAWERGEKRREEKGEERGRVVKRHSWKEREGRSVEVRERRKEREIMAAFRAGTVFLAFSAPVFAILQEDKRIQ